MTTSLDLYASWPPVGRSAARTCPERLQKARSATIEAPGLDGRRRRMKADPNRIAQVLSRLVTLIGARGLGAFMPVAEDLPRIVGVDDIDRGLFNEFLGAFLEVVSDTGTRWR